MQVQEKKSIIKKLKRQQKMDDSQKRGKIDLGKLLKAADDPKYIGDMVSSENDTPYITKKKKINLDAIVKKALEGEGENESKYIQKKKKINLDTIVKKALEKDK
jgi:hypothetical protein